ncbi:GNAT family N-acetyltransferase [Streptomyces sp. NPDC048243]|uniref:GNAT family N-acetyltransferase n=1 Tax=Streptomyces sp. NPDC048243 TaxID=3365522 RepID=UPI003718FC8E
MKIERTDARAWPDEQLKELFSEGFPEFISADRLVKEYIGRVREWFACLDLMLVDEHEVPVAAGWGVPIHWDGLTGTLPTGYSQALVRAVEGREQGTEANTLVICGAVVTPSLKGRGLAGEILKALRRTAEEAGLVRIVAPVRPTMKASGRPLRRSWRVQRAQCLDAAQLNRDSTRAHGGPAPWAPGCDAVSGCRTGRLRAGFR